MSKNIFPVSKAKAEKLGILFPSKQNRNALFPVRLRELRTEKRISQQMLADTLKVSKSTIGYWENGDSLPDVESLAMLADFYDVSTDYLLCRSDVRSAEVSMKAICEATGLQESAVAALQELQESNISGDENSAHAAMILGAVNLLTNYPMLLEEIGSYLLFQFDHFELEECGEAPAVGQSQVLKVINTLGLGIQMGKEGFEDLLLLNIQQRLKELHLEQTDAARNREYLESLSEKN